jgi:hypothetical protein
LYYHSSKTNYFFFPSFQKRQNNRDFNLANLGTVEHIRKKTWLGINECHTGGN